MTNDDLEELLRRWGAFQNGRTEPKSEDPSVHAIAKAREFAMSKKQFANKVAGRDGRGRRKMMAAKVGIKGFNLIPAYAVDPIRCKETRHATVSNDHGMPADMLRIDRAAMDLYRSDKLMGVVLRIEYLTPGLQRDKACRVSSIVGEHIKLRMYRQKLEHARVWLLGRLAA